MSLEHDIHELLQCHDCVIVPELGGFLTHYRPSRLDEPRQLIHPPSKDLSFNKHLVRNDGLLSDRVASTNRIDLPAANARIAAKVNEWRGILGRDGRLELDKVGVLFHDAERNLRFEPDRRTNLLRAAYGLRPLPAVPAPVKKEEVPVEPLLTKEERNGGRATNWLWAAATVSALVFGLGAWYVAYNSTSDGAQWSSLLPWDREPTHYKEREALPSFPGTTREVDLRIPKDTTGMLRIALDEEGAAMLVDMSAAAEPVSTEVSPTRTTPGISTGPYHVIGGCFSIEENAHGLVNELRARGFDARILDQHRGLFRVTYGSFPQKSAALEALAAVRRKEAPQAWLLVKR